jgi:hypothetical protein
MNAAKRFRATIEDHRRPDATAPACFNPYQFGTSVAKQSRPLMTLTPHLLRFINCEWTDRLSGRSLKALIARTDRV